MRVLLTATAGTDQRIDGITVFTAGLARGLSARGHECALFVADLGRHPATADLAEARVEGTRVFRVATPAPCTPAEALDRPGVRGLFEGVLAAFSPDVVHFNAIELLAAGIIEAAHESGLPAVMTLHDFYLLCAAVRLLEVDGTPCPGPPCGERCGTCLAATGGLTGRYRGPLRWLRRRWDVRIRHRYAGVFRDRSERMRRVLRLLDAVVSPSQYLGDRTVQAGMLEDFEVIRNGSGLSPLPPAGGEGAPVLGMLAHHSRAKGTLLLAEAIRGLRDVPLRFEIHGMGDPRCLASARRTLRADGRVTFHGRYEPAAVESVLAGLSAVIVPSLYPENCPLVVQDALAAGRPCIVPSDSGAAELVVHERHGLHFERGNRTSLAAAVRRLVTESGLIARCREHILADRPVSENGAVAERYLDLYRDIAERKQHG